MDRKEFFHAIADSFFKDLSTDFIGLCEMVNGALPVFGTLATEITDKEDGGKMIVFIDVDQADLVMTPEGIQPEDVNTDMTTTVAIIHLDKENVIKIVSQHGMQAITPANKNHHLFLASLIGKKVIFE